jgi:hypothetical protein
MQVHRQAHTGLGALLPPFPGQEEEDGESTFKESLQTPDDSLRTREDSLAIQEDSDDAQEDRLMIQEDSNGIPEEGNGIPEEGNGIPEEGNGIPEEGNGIPEEGMAIPNGKGAAEAGLRDQEDSLLLTHHNGGHEEMKKGEIRVKSMLNMRQEEEEGMDVDMIGQDDKSSDRSAVTQHNSHLC